MKQFKYTKRDGTTKGPYSEGDIMGFDEHTHGALTLAFGQTWQDADGDTWPRIDGDADCGPRADDRLERIATAGLVALIPLSDLLAARGTSPAKEALRHARELIAELDAST